MLRFDRKKNMLDIDSPHDTSFRHRTINITWMYIILGIWAGIFAYGRFNSPFILAAKSTVIVVVVSFCVITARRFLKRRR